MAGRMLETSCCDRVCKSPRLVNVSPVDGGSDPVGLTVVFTFNEAVSFIRAVWAIDAEVCNLDGSPITPFTATLSDDGKVLTLNHVGGAIDCAQVIARVLVRNACGKKRWFSTCYTAGDCT